MAITADSESSNPVVRARLAEIGPNRGTHIGNMVAPDVVIDDERVSFAGTVEHDLNLDDLRAEDALAKAVQFKGGQLTEISVREHMQKSTIDKRRIENAVKNGRPDPTVARAARHRRDIEDVKEYRTAAILLNGANYGGTHKNLATGAVFGVTGILDLFDEKRNLILDDGGQDVTGLMVTPDVFRFLKGNPDIIAYAGEGRGVTLELIAEYLGVGKVFVGRYARKLKGVVTQFWGTGNALLFSNQDVTEISDQIFAATPVVPYGATFNRAGVLTDVRTAPLSGVEGIVEVAAAQRYGEYIFNANLAFLWKGITG